MKRPLCPIFAALTLSFFVLLGCTGEGKGKTQAPPLSSPSMPAAAAPPVLHKGLDVSWHSGSVDWGQVEDQGHTFAFVKATEGVDLKDPMFDAHWAEMKKEGLIRGAYHFYVAKDSPVDQAKFFIRNVRLEPGDFAPVLDIEVMDEKPPENFADQVKIWLDLVEKHYGVKPILYTTPNFGDAYFEGKLGEYPLWIAEYEVDAPRLPDGWSHWHIWQFRENAPIEGVEKGADLSHVNGDKSIEVLLIP